MRADTVVNTHCPDASSVPVWPPGVGVTSSTYTVAPARSAGITTPTARAGDEGGAGGVGGVGRDGGLGGVGRAGGLGGDSRGTTGFEPSPDGLTNALSRPIGLLLVWPPTDKRPRGGSNAAAGYRTLRCRRTTRRKPRLWA